MAWSFMALPGVCAFCLLRIMVFLERIARQLEYLPRVVTTDQLSSETAAIRHAIRAAAKPTGSDA